MTNFMRALAGEFYLFSRRRSIRVMHAVIFALACLIVLINYSSISAFAAMNNMPLSDVASFNFWPQWASATHITLYLVELSVILLIAGSMPHEIMTASIRDPLTRRISRSSLVLARAVVAMVIPLSLYACALLGAAFMSSILFDAGDILEEGELLMSIETDGVASALYRSMWHAVLPLLTLGVVAAACGAIFKRGVVAVGACLVMVLIPTMLYDNFASIMPYYFADFLPAFGPDSFLDRTAQFAAGYSDAYPYEYDEVANIGWLSPLPLLCVAIIMTIVSFRRRSL
ncbi:MAG: hypothetical protein ACI84O_001083 [Myxococcota bacterium]|jgi:hypothetical protein